MTDSPERDERHLARMLRKKAVIDERIANSPNECGLLLVLTARDAIDDRVRDEFRSQMIMPLALGADSGRRMGATMAVTPLANAPERPRLDLVATLAQGDGFDRMLRRAKELKA